MDPFSLLLLLIFPLFLNFLPLLFLTFLFPFHGSKSHFLFLKRRHSAKNIIGIIFWDFFLRKTKVEEIQMSASRCGPDIKVFSHFLRLCLKQKEKWPIFLPHRWLFSLEKGRKIGISYSLERTPKDTKEKKCWKLERDKLTDVRQFCQW